jgi:predicted dehydrogenase
MLRNVPAKVELYKGKDAMHEVYTPLCGWTWAFRRQAEAFVRDIREGREPISSGADALEDMRLVEEMWRQQISKD